MVMRPGMVSCRTARSPKGSSSGLRAGQLVPKLSERLLVERQQLAPGALGVRLVVDRRAVVCSACPARTSRAAHPDRLRSRRDCSRRRTLPSACPSRPAGCMSSFAAMPKYMRALIFGASRCGLSGLSVTRPPPWNERAGADAIRHRRGGLHHQRPAHAVALRADLLRLVHLLLRVQECDVRRPHPSRRRPARSPTPSAA